jgi:hypothetical protein
MALRSTKEVFLSNKENKQRFLSLLGSCLEQTCTVLHAKADADLQIVLAAQQSAKSKATAVVGEDTDLLVLLTYHISTTDHGVYFYSDKLQQKKKVWDIKRLIDVLGFPLRHLLLVLHALTGSDTTSRPFGIGKAAALRKLRSSACLQKVAQRFLEASSVSEAEAAGETALVLLYGGNEPDKIDDLRYRTFCRKVALGTTFVQVNTLPPTSAAARFHSHRVYWQVQDWMGNQLDPTTCGWKLEGNMLLPVTTLLPAAPSKLLKIIRCTCTGNCDSNSRCTFLFLLFFLLPAQTQF